MKSPHRTRALIAAALLGVSTAALAEDVTVKLPTATVLAGKTARSAKVAQLSEGQKLQVLGREGSWLKVKIGEKEGYVHENAVSASGGGGGEGLGGLGKMLGSASGASSATSAEAGRGIGESEKWAQSKNMSAAGLQRMIAIRNSVSDADWQRFAGDDKGPAK
jgi:hypothetical protein